jgi:LemA protein
MAYLINALRFKKRTKKRKIMELLTFLFFLLIIFFLYVFYLYNKLVSLLERSKNAISQIDVQLKRRAELIPNLVETVKGYMKYERETLEKITSLRASIVSGSINERLASDKKLEGMLKTIFAVSENYPKLKASSNFLQLQEELVTTENRIAYARQAYNDVVYIYNSTIKMFPNNIIASILNFKELDYLKETEEEVKVGF